MAFSSKISNLKQQMMIIIFLSLFFFVSNFYNVTIPLPHPGVFNSISGLIKKNKNEYVLINNQIYSSYAHKLKIEYDNLTFFDEKYFSGHHDDAMLSTLIIDNNLIIYSFMFYSFFENNGKTNEIVWGDILGDKQRFVTQTFNSDCLLICTWTYNFSLNSAFHYEERYDFQLLLIKPPYIEISKEIEMETLAKNRNIQLINTKDYFIYIRYEEDNHKRNITYKFLDFDLYLVNSLTKEYENYSEIYYYSIPNDDDVNKFMMCFLKNEDILENLNTYKCQIIAYKNKELQIIQSIDIPITHGKSIYYLKIIFFNKNKIAFYLYHLKNYFSYFSSPDNDYINILQYENQVFSFYKNYKNLTLQKLVDRENSRIDFIMTEQGLAILAGSDFNYLSSICVPKTITLYANQLSKFPIEEFIFPGVDPLRFSFEEISDFITIYKNSTEIKKGEVYSDLNNFTYFLKIDKIFTDIKLRVKNHEFDFICNINIDVYIDTNISTYKENQKCFKNDDYEEINNILYSNLYDYFTIKNERAITIEFIMEKEPKGNELRFYFDQNFQDYFDDHNSLLCRSNSTKIICDKIPIYVLPKLKRIHLYSYLSCYNFIDVGWFELNYRDVFDIFSLINYDFDTISEIYDPSKNISEYNPAMINYYYWFSCISYCDDIKLERKECCNNILDKWEIVFHKEYKYEEGVLDFIIDKMYDLIEWLIKRNKKKHQNPPSSSSSGSGSNDNPNSDSRYNIDDDTDLIEHLTNIVNSLVDLSTSIISPMVNNTPVVQSVITINNPNAKKWKDFLGLDLKELIKQLKRIVYEYNFVILKNDEYKKIIVVFPGILSYLQMLDEIIYEGLEILPISDGKTHYYVMDYYYKIFNKIEEDLLNNLKSLTGMKDEDYQIIFTGHSIGGAVATIASFFYNKKYIKEYDFKAQNILITFGQPRVGSERFAKEITNIMNGQIYRVARPSDVATVFPMKNIDYLVKFIKINLLGFDFMAFCIKLAMTGDIGGLIEDSFNFILNINDFKEENWYLIQDRDAADCSYTHSGGLYMIDDESNTIYHCDDFFNEKRNHFLCKNHKIELYQYITDFKSQRNYLTLDQDIMSGCQQQHIRFIKLLDSNHYIETRRLENKINYKYNNYNFHRRRNLNNNEDIDVQTLKLFQEIKFGKNKEFYFKYESAEKLQIDNLFLIINPKNNYFFGELCLTQNITWLIYEQYKNINCYFINTQNPFSLKIILQKDIIDEKELYIYLNGKISGTLELYDLTKNKTLNISYSYYIPYISGFSLEKSLNFVLPKIKEEIYMNIIINDYISDKNMTNITNFSIFEIYKDNDIIDYKNTSAIILEKDKNYYFKYYPGEYKLIINFISIYSNKFLEKKFYIVNEQNIHFSYNIDSIKINQIFGLFFDFYESINIKGYFSNNINENTNNSNIYTLNTYNKYFNLTKNIDRYNYFNLDIKVESEFELELIVYDFHEVIIINKMDSIYEINKTKNYMFLLDENLIAKYSKVESYIVISINNDNNVIKLITKNGDIITSKNYLLTKLYNIKEIFIKTNEDDTFMIKLISEEISKYLNEENPSNYVNSFIEEKKYSIDFIHTDKQVNIFYNSNSNDLKIYEINNGSYFQLEDFIKNNNEYNYSLLLSMKLLEEKKTYMILKKSSNPFLYEKYIDNSFLTLNHFLYESKIVYLLSNFEYRFSYNKKVKKILMKVLNNTIKKGNIYFYCNNKTSEIKSDIHILNVEKCHGTFVIEGYNSLIYFYLPYTVIDIYNIIENTENFELNDVYHFFFIPKNNEFNSINILLEIENEDTIDPAFLYYYIDYGIIPYSRNIEKRQIIFKKEANIVIPNYSKNSNDNEKYFIYFRFNTTLSKLNGKIIYENIIYLEDQTYIILEPGINIIKFSRNIDHYLNITKYNKNKKDSSSYTIYKDEKVIEHNIINDRDNIIYIEEPVYRENIKLKIENNVKILVRVSPEKFEDCSIISYDTNIDIRQIENILSVKFNTTNYKSRLEYQIALIEKEENIDHLIIHQKFYDNNLIYKNTIYSSGKESIETNISLSKNTNNFSYDKDYTLIAYGKDYFGDSINYFYMEPASLYISNPNTPTLNKKNNTITNTSTIPEINNSDNSVIGPIIDPKSSNDIKETNVVEHNNTDTKNIIDSSIISTTKTISESTSITSSNSESKSSNNESNDEIKSDKNIIESSTIPITSMEGNEEPKKTIPYISSNTKSDDSKTNTIAIVFALIGGVVLLGVIVGFIIYYKMKIANIDNINQEPSSAELNPEINKL